MRSRILKTSYPVQTSLGLFRSASEAARAHGVTPDAVYRALDKGTIEDLGKVKTSKGWTNSKSIIVQGQQFPDSVTAALYFGISYGYFCRLRLSGKLEKYLEKKRNVK